MKLSKFRHLHLIDISWLLYKSYFAMQELEFTGKKTGHFKGLCDFLSKLHELFQTEPNQHYALFVFDSLDKYRKSIYPEYKLSDARIKTKAKAPVMSADYDNFQKLIAIFPNMASMEVKGYEADDIIIHLAKLYAKSHKVYVYSKDYDMFVLRKLGVQFKQNVTTFINVKEAIKKKYRIEDYSIIPYIKILNGDTSDNIPPIFDLRQTKKIIAKWKQDAKITLFSDELLAEKKLIQRNIKLILPMKVERNLTVILRESFTDKSILDVIMNHGLYSLLGFLRKPENKKLLKGVTNEKRESRKAVESE